VFGIDAAKGLVPMDRLVATSAGPIRAVRIPDHGDDPQRHLAVMVEAHLQAD